MHFWGVMEENLEYDYQVLKKLYEKQIGTFDESENTEEELALLVRLKQADSTIAISHEDKQKAIRIRLQRALSWLERAEKESDDLDAGFIFYWVSFNATYSKPKIAENETESDRFKAYFARIVACDKESKVYELIFRRFSSEINRILQNKYIFGLFWQAQSGEFDGSWKQIFDDEKKRIATALNEESTAVILKILFSRLYVLRNQLLHGNATWEGKTNRTQVRDGYQLISKLQPVFLAIMILNYDKDWGYIMYPRLTS